MTSYLLRFVREPGTGAVRDLRLRDGRIRLAPAGTLDPEPDEELLDAQGRWLIPGLWDDHVHFDQWAQARTRTDLSDCASAEEALDAVRAALVAEAAGGRGPGRGSGGSGVLFGFGFRSSAWEHQPTVAQLDAVTGPRPVVLISGDMHNGWLNSAALDLVGEPPRTGAVTENEWFPLYGVLEQFMPDASALVPQAVEAAARRGVVGITDLEFAANHEVWARRFAQGITGLRVRTGVYQEDLPGVLARGLRTGDRLLPPQEDPAGQLRMGPLKIISDGSLGTRTAHCCAPYLQSPDPQHPRGVQNESPEHLHQLLGTAREAGLEVALHAIGDAAVHHAVAAFARTGARGSIEHAQLMLSEDLPAMAALGITASVQPAHLLDDRDVTDVLWADRAERSFMFAAMLRAGIPLALGSDAPVSPLDPWLAMAAAVHRSGDERPPWHQEEAISPAQALAASTHGVGRLRTGDVADLALVEEDPLGGKDSADSGRILRGMSVAATFLAGRPTHCTL